MKLIRLERKGEQLVPRWMFFWRMVFSFGLALVLIVFALLLGMVLHHSVEPGSWQQAFHRASMTLSGMGVERDPGDNATRIFAGIYALFCSFVVVTTIALILTPVLHRVLHHFHLDDGDDERAAPHPRRAKPKKLRKVPKRNA